MPLLQMILAVRFPLTLVKANVFLQLGKLVQYDAWMAFRFSIGLAKIKKLWIGFYSAIRHGSAFLCLNI